MMNSLRTLLSNSQIIEKCNQIILSDPSAGDRETPRIYLTNELFNWLHRFGADDAELRRNSGEGISGREEEIERIRTFKHFKIWETSNDKTLSPLELEQRDGQQANDCFSFNAFMELLIKAKI